ncbi:hypothetical protein [Brevibacillus choshinensis]|uniref:hypothetical protein n=1 Tax=Brevibacillus choshinensis TaxID=54911 RepID=UPI002E214425|nr:hypothetical protein [Brevibacillus choshinensis]
MKRSYLSEGQLTPQKVVQLLENGKVANLPLKDGAGKMNLKPKTTWANASGTTSSNNCTITFFDDTRALQTITDNYNLKMRVVKVAEDFAITLNPIYQQGQSRMLFPFKRSDTEIMFVSKTNSGWSYELIFVTIDANDNLTIETVPLFTPAQSLSENEMTLHIIQVEGTQNDFILCSQYTSGALNFVMLPFRVEGRAVTLGNIFVHDPAYYGNSPSNIAMWDVGKIALYHVNTLSNQSPLMSTFAINDLTITLLYRDTYPNSELGTTLISRFFMQKLSKGRIVLNYADPQTVGTPQVLRIVEFDKRTGKPIFASKRTIVANSKAVSTPAFTMLVTAENVGFSYGKMNANSTDPFYNKGTFWAWGADGDEFIMAPYLIFDDGASTDMTQKYPSYSLNKSRTKALISFIALNSFAVNIRAIEVVEQQHVGKVLGVAESTSTIALSGVVNGFQGLVPGSEYVYDMNGNIAAIDKVYSQNKPIGRAINSNSLLMYDYLLK